MRRDLLKGLSGYDFSAYAVALREVATRSPGADLLLINDSVLGPFVDLDTLLEEAPWDLTGFTAYSLFENHVQSYALYFRNVTSPLLRSLRTVIPHRFAFNHHRRVVRCQETRMARVAARTMSVGALWYSEDSDLGDPSLASAVPLLNALASRSSTFSRRWKAQAFVTNQP